VEISIISVSPGKALGPGTLLDGLHAMRWKSPATNSTRCGRGRRWDWVLCWTDSHATRWKSPATNSTRCGRGRRWDRVFCSTDSFAARSSRAPGYKRGRCFSSPCDPGIGIARLRPQLGDRDFHRRGSAAVGKSFVGRRFLPLSEVRELRLDTCVVSAALPCGFGSRGAVNSSLEFQDPPRATLLVVGSLHATTIGETSFFAPAITMNPLRRQLLPPSGRGQPSNAGVGRGLPATHVDTSAVQDDGWLAGILGSATDIHQSPSAEMHRAPSPADVRRPPTGDVRRPSPSTQTRRPSHAATSMDTDVEITDAR
jgi:hypothetical protein